MNKKPRQLRAYMALAWYAFRAMMRNPSTFAFGFIFPIVFISIFGLIGNAASPLIVGIPQGTNEQNPVVQIVEKQSFIKVQKDTEANLETQLRQGKVHGILTIEPVLEKYTVAVQTSSANPQQAASLTAFVKTIVDETNLRLSGITHPPVTFVTEQVSGQQFRYIDFALPGQIGFSLLSTAIFGTVFGLIFLKKALVLKRMFATPTKPPTILLA